MMDGGTCSSGGGRSIAVVAVRSRTVSSLTMEGVMVVRGGGGGEGGREF